MLLAALAHRLATGDTLRWFFVFFIVVVLLLVELGVRRRQTNRHSQSHTTMHKQVFCLYSSSYYTLLPVRRASLDLHQTLRAKVVSDSVQSRVDVLGNMLIEFKTLRTGRGGAVEY